MQMKVTCIVPTLGILLALCIPFRAAAQSSSVTFLRSDATTQGNWHGAYGADGYSVAEEDSQNLPGYALFAVQNQQDYTWAASTTDPRALQTGSGLGRIAATWYNASTFSLDVNLADGNPHQVAIYAIDWDNQGRAETIQILDATTAAILDTRNLSNFTGGIYLVWTITGHVTVSITQNSGPNAVLGAVFFGGSSTITSAATFLQSDTTTQGNWHGAYGADGYSLANDLQSIPAYASFAPQNQSNWTWAASTTDPRALQTGSGVGRIAATWYATSDFDLDVNLTDGHTHQISLYAVDWDSQGRSEVIQVLDAATEAVLDRETLSAFTNGEYLVWNISGHVKINVIQSAGPNAVVSGVFFGGSSAVSSTASFLRFDTTTQGNWHGAYGADGYSVANDSQSLPSYASFTPQNQSNWSWSSNPTETSALQTGSGVGRIAAAWDNNPAFSFDVNITDGNSHQIALYALDFDSQGRSEVIQVLDAATEALLDTRTVSSFTNGTYLVWNISGHVTINVIEASGPNAVVSGVFFGGSSAISSTATFVSLDGTTQGNWQGMYGADGYSIASASQSLPPYASFAVQNESTWIWDPNPTDVRSLETGTGSARIAATWYNNPSFSFDVNLTDGNTHRVSIYAVDWDSQGRSEIVQVLDAATEAVLDTETLNAFTNGDYLVWNISGHVRINVIGMSGPNAVVSGVFFDPSTSGGSGSNSPTITSLSPTSGPIGTQVTISGTNFGSTQGSSTVTFNGALAAPTSWSNTTILVSVPPSATTGSVAVSVGPAQNIGPVFTVIPLAQLNTGRYQHSATLLNNGTVLIAGGVTCPTSGPCTYLGAAEIYDPASGTSTNTGSLATPRSAPAVLLANGQVLIAGGSTCDSYGNCFSLSSAEIYDPGSGTFTSAGNMQYARDGHTMTLLADGRVLIAGGEGCFPGGRSRGSENLGEPFDGGAHIVYASFTPVASSISCSVQSSAEIYDPQSGTFSLTGSLNTARYEAAAIRLADGRVLVVGGSDEYSPLSSGEIYNPATASFTASASALETARSSPAATLLNSGLVLVTGGSTCDAPVCPTNTAELYDATADAFRYTSGNMNASRVSHTASLLTNGQVLLTGGTNGCSQSGGCNSDGTSELYDPTADIFTVSQPLQAARSGHTATLLQNGSVLLAGGIQTGITLSSVELYQPSALAPANLVSIAVAPANTSIFPGGIVQFVATGTFSDGSSSALESAAWNSSNTNSVTISNAVGTSGFAFGISLGSTTITATVGGLSGSTTLTVQPLFESGGFSTVGGQITMASPLYGQTATRLTTGQVLIVGGMSTSGVSNGAQLYTPTSHTFAAVGSLNVPRWSHTATLLNDGTVLIAGGSDLANQETLDSAEIYNPATGTFTLLSNTLNTARVGHTATLLNNGQVLLVGGYDPDTGLIADAELYDPPTQSFIDLGDTNAPRYRHTATMLQNGQVLIAGGETDPVPSGAYNTAELFDPTNQTFAPVSLPMTTGREGHAAVLLNNGQVLITGGNNPGDGPLNTAELYDPGSNMFIGVPSVMTTPRIFQEMALLNGGTVLIVGGTSAANGPALPSGEIYNPTTQFFTFAGNMASAREYQTTTLLNDGTVLIVGGTDGTNISNTSELYVLSVLNGLTSIAIAPANPSIGNGAQQLLTAVGTFSDGSTETLSSVEWSSSNASVAVISNDATNSGAAASLSQGTTTVTASAVGISGSTAMTITAPTLVSIQISPTNFVLPLQTTEQFTATGVYTDGSTQDLTSSAVWNSSAPAVASITTGGVASGLLQGVTTIQVSFGSVTTATTLQVGPPALVSIAVNPTSAAVAAGASQQFRAVGTYSDGSTQDVTQLVSWSSTTTGVATIGSTGLALGVGQGTTTITATSSSLTITAQLTVGPPTLVSLVIAPDAAVLSLGSTQQLTATGTYTDGSTQNLTASASWNSSDAGVAGVSSSGMTAAASVGEATITVTSGTTSAIAILFVTSGTTQANLNTSRYLHSTTMLETGQILVAGGVSCPSAGSCAYLNSAELYDPASSTFTNTGAMAQARSAPSVLLTNGNVLIAGGYACDPSGNCSSLSSAEIYNPTAGTFSSAGNMTAARSGHTMTLLGNGTVLIAGGQTCTTATSCNALSSAEIYDPVAGTFTPTPNGLNAARYGASAVLLQSGQVMIAGGFDGTNLPAIVEIYNPTQRLFIYSGVFLNTPRFAATATLLNSGQVLLAGGSTCSLPGCPTNAAEIYYPALNNFITAAGTMVVARFDHTATLLTNGQVLIAGGFSSCASSCTSESSTEIFDPVAGVFSSSQSLGSAVSGQTGTLDANGNVLVIGGINAGVTLASDQWYQPASLTPPGLVSISVSPASLLLLPGQTQPLIATGTFNDGSTETLQSVIWTSSNPSAALVGNSTGSAGTVNAQAQGATTITALTGTISGAASVTVATPVSLSVTPVNPTLALGTSQQMTATATFSDGSVQNVSTYASWTSSNNSVVFVGNTTGLQGDAIPAAVGTSNITATFGGVSAGSLVTVQTTLFNPPSISSVSPSTGAAGTQVTISGSGFGATQGTGTVWLGSTYGIVNSWSDSQIVATVAAISTSGSAVVQQAGLMSNAVPFGVNTATISYISPSSDAPGSQVTISGSGFGATQGSGQVFLGTANGIVQSWSDSQIVAEVALGSMSGSARVLQNGVLSNAVPFIVSVPQISGLTPNSGGPGTRVTITGSGFGASQGNGTVWIGGASAEVMSWADTQVVAVVPSNALTGVVRIEEDDVWSNTVTFTVPPTVSSASSVTLVPNVLNMVVGQTQTLQALNASGQSVTGLTWASSNQQVVSLSTDDPPVLTALAAGHVTISAGNASADVTVYFGPTLPLGTVIWSDPGDGTGVSGILPAVPSETGVADVLALNSDCNVQAITADGGVAWTANIGEPPLYSSSFTACNQFLPDFQGGMIVESETGAPLNPEIPSQHQIQRFDGITGQAYPAYDLQNLQWIDMNFHFGGGSLLINTYPPSVVDTDGTVFVIDGNDVDVVDPQTGQATAFAAPYYPNQPFDSFTLIAYGNLIVAGDGYAYVPYEFSAPGVITIPNDCGQPSRTYFGLLRMGSAGDFSTIPIGQWDGIVCGVSSGVATAYVITDADQGALVSWQLQSPASTTNYLTVTSGTSVVSQAAINVPGQVALQPVLQRQDGSYVGAYGTPTRSYTPAGALTFIPSGMLAFTPSGNALWAVPNDAPQIATADNGVIGTSGATYDADGNASGQLFDISISSWRGNAYQQGSIKSVVAEFDLANIATTYAAAQGMNLSGTGTSTASANKTIRQMIAQIAQSYIGSENWLDQAGLNQCNIFIHDVIKQAGSTPPQSDKTGIGRRIKYYLGLVDSPNYPAQAADWANPNKTLGLWKTLSVPPTAPAGTRPPDLSQAGDVIAEAIHYQGATGHVGIVARVGHTISADSAVSCYNPPTPAGTITDSNYGFRPDNWVDPIKNAYDPRTGLYDLPCRTHGYEKDAVVKRFTGQ